MQMPDWCILLSLREEVVLLPSLDVGDGDILIGPTDDLVAGMIDYEITSS